jgi:hypothetical protein
MADSRPGMTNKNTSAFFVFAGRNNFAPLLFFIGARVDNEADSPYIRARIPEAPEINIPGLSRRGLK